MDRARRMDTEHCDKNGSASNDEACETDIEDSSSETVMSVQRQDDGHRLAEEYWYWN